MLTSLSRAVFRFTLFIAIVFMHAVFASESAYPAITIEIRDETIQGQQILPLSEYDVFSLNTYTTNNGDAITYIIINVVSITPQVVNCPKQIGSTVSVTDFLNNAEIMVYDKLGNPIYPTTWPLLLPGGQPNPNFPCSGIWQPDTTNQPWIYGDFAFMLSFNPSSQDAGGNLILGDMPLSTVNDDEPDYYIKVNTSDMLQPGVEFLLEIGEQQIQVNEYPNPLRFECLPGPGELARQIEPGWFRTNCLQAVVLSPSVLDLLPVPGDPQDANLYIGRFPGYFDDTPGEDTPDPDEEPQMRYKYSPPGIMFRPKYAAQIHDLISGVKQDSFERFYFTNFEIPELFPLERRFAAIGLEVIGKTTQKLTELTVTFTNDNAAGYPIFDPLQDLDPIRYGDSESTAPYFSGITVYNDTNGSGRWDEVAFTDAANFVIDPGTNDLPLLLKSGMSPPYEVLTNSEGTVWSIRLFFEEEQGERNKLNAIADGKPNFFIVLRMDSGRQDDSGLPPDNNGIDFGARFKVSLERAEDLNGNGSIDPDLEEDTNGDGIPQPYPVIITDSVTGSRQSINLAILADNEGVEDQFKEMKPIFPVIAMSDLCMDFGLDNNPPHARIRQTIDATSPPTPIIGINACSSNVPQVGFLDDLPTIDLIKLQFDGRPSTGFQPEDIEEILIFRDDKSPYTGAFFQPPHRNIGIFDIVNDIFNNPPPGSPLGGLTNPAETSPIALSTYEIVDIGNDVFEAQLTMQGNKPEIYPQDSGEDGKNVSTGYGNASTIDTYTDNFSIDQYNLPNNEVFWGHDYFISVRTSEAIAYKDIIRPVIPLRGLRTSREAVYAGSADFTDPEVMAESSDSGYPAVRQLTANVPVTLHNLVPPEATLEKSSGYVPVIGIDTFTNVAAGPNEGVEVFLEQLFIQFIEAGGRVPKSFNLQQNGDLRPFVNVNGPNSAVSGIRVRRRYDGAAYVVRFDTVSPAMRAQGLENPSLVGPEDVGNQGVLMAFNTDDPEMRDLLRIPEDNTGEYAGVDFIIEIATSENFDPNADNFSVAIISWGPESPGMPKPSEILHGLVPTNENTTFEALNAYQNFPQYTRGIGFVDSSGVHSRSFESINTNAFNATRATLLNAVEDFRGDLCGSQVTNPTRQVSLVWVDTNNDNPQTAFINENEDGYWIETNIFGDFQPLPNNPLSADTSQLFFEGPPFLSGRTVTFRIFPFRNTVDWQPIEPPFNGLGPAATTSVTFETSLDLAPPIADFDPDPPKDCTPLTVHFVDTSQYEPEVWEWDFGDDSPKSSEQNPAHTYELPGVYNACLTVTNRCGSDAICKDVTASPVIAEFSADLAEGCAPLMVCFTDDSRCDPDTWQWNFGDGSMVSPKKNPCHVYEASGVYTVTLTVANADGTDTIMKTDYITVRETPDSDFTADPAEGCAALAVDFTDTSKFEPTSWEWDFGDGSPKSTVQNPSHTYIRPGVFSACLTAANECGSDTACQEISVTGVIADFSASVNEGCLPLEVCFTDLSQCEPATWEWDFGDGSAVSTEMSPCHLYEISGEYRVTLRVTSPYGSDIESKSDFIIVRDVPEADFKSEHTGVCVEQTITFDDLSTGLPDTWEWDFGDGSPPATEQNPSHEYTQVGLYSVGLTVSNACGSDSIYRNDYITIYEPVQAGFLAVPDSGCEPLEVCFFDASSGSPTGRLWDFGDGMTSDLPSPCHTYAESGTYDACLTVANPCGPDQTCRTVTVYGVPQADFVADVTVGEAPFEVCFTDLSAGGNIDAWLWLFGDGSNSTQQNPCHVYNEPGIYTVTLAVSSACGQDDMSVSGYIRVYDRIRLLSPAEGAYLEEAPTFAWSPSINDRFRVEFSFEPGFKTLLAATPILQTTSFVVPTTIWDRVPVYKKIYWRVKGADEATTPPRIHQSEVRTFWRY